MSVYHTTPHHTTPHNFFSVKDNFFIIDSENLADVKTKFYGFSVQESGIYDRDNFTPEATAGLDGNGTYVYVEKAGDEIVIRQDFAGCYGIYVYNQGGRFVISNSFLYLMEYMSRRVKLTLNRDYANHYLIMGLSSMAYSETFINEITVLPRDVNVRIDIPSAKFSTERINYGENTVRLNSPEGMKILDEWFAKWTGILRNIYDKTGTLEADLSGGFDSRMSFTLLMNAGIDLNRINIASRSGKAYTYNEDYGIASEIAEHFGFTLNNKENQTGGELNYSTDDVLKVAFYSMMFVHNHLMKSPQKFEDKRYHVTGFWGETVRASLHPADKSFMLGNKSGANIFSGGVKNELTNSMEHILTHLLEEISRKINAPVSDYFSPHIYREVGSGAGRFHFGPASVMYSMSNVYNLNPMADKELSRLKLDDENCLDQNLLMALIFTRYCPDLLKFRFVKKDKPIRLTTVRFAEKISAKFPRAESSIEPHNFSLAVRDPEVSKLLAENNAPLDEAAFDDYSLSVFRSTALRKLFATCFDEELCVYAEEVRKKTVHYPLSKCHTIIAAAEVIKHIIISEGTQERSITDDFREFKASEFVSESDKKLDTSIRRKLLYRKIAMFPFRALRKIYRIIRRK